MTDENLTIYVRFNREGLFATLIPICVSSLAPANDVIDLLKGVRIIHGKPLLIYDGIVLDLFLSFRAQNVKNESQVILYEYFKRRTVRNRIKKEIKSCQNDEIDEFILNCHYHSLKDRNFWHFFFDSIETLQKEMPATVIGPNSTEVSTKPLPDLEPEPPENISILDTYLCIKKKDQDDPNEWTW